MTQLIAIVGATGTGKSLLADALALRVGGEIISADSMQVYRNMDIGTAKTPPAERGVPYHCIDLVDPDFPFTAALYQRESRRVIENLLAQGITPVLCGGTGLYVRAALDHFDFDESRELATSELATSELAYRELATSELAYRELATGELATSELATSSLREQLNAQAAELGFEAFHTLLAKRDPNSAELIHPHNVRRVIRAFELLEQGTSYAEQHAGFGDFSAVYPTRFIGISVDPAVLYKTIEHRVDSMIASGLLDEVQGLLDAGFRKAATAQQAIGYKELVLVLEGARPLADVISEIKQSTRRYAKRQRTWFKRDPRITWIDATDLHSALLAEELSKERFGADLLKRASDLLQLDQQRGSSYAL